MSAESSRDYFNTKTVVEFIYKQQVILCFACGEQQKKGKTTHQRMNFSFECSRSRIGHFGEEDWVQEEGT